MSGWFEDVRGIARFMTKICRIFSKKPRKIV